MTDDRPDQGSSAPIRVAISVSRQQQLGQLLAAARAAVGGRGSVLFLSGSRGSDKSALIESLVDAVTPAHGKPDSIPVSVKCYERGKNDPLGPCWEILAALADRPRWGDRAKRVLELIEKIAPGILELIPVAGPVAAKTTKVAAGAAGAVLGRDHAEQQVEHRGDVARVLHHVAHEIPLLLIIDDAQWIDDASAQVIEMVAEGIESRRLLLVIAYDADLVDDLHPLIQARTNVLLSDTAVPTINLEGLALSEVEAALRARYGGVLPARLAEWLLDRTDGRPVFLEQYLMNLELTGILRETERGWELDGTIEGEPGDWQVSGALANAQTPDALAQLLRTRVAGLEKGDQTLLEYGAFQGRRFLTKVVAKVIDGDESEVDGRLYDLGESRHMLRPEKTDGWWRKRSTQYAFDPGQYETLLYSRFEERDSERLKRHRLIAEALEELIDAERSPPRHVLLEIGRQYEKAGEPVAAGGLLVRIADSTLREGADRETVANAERAVELLRTSLSDGSVEDDDRLEAQDLLSRAIVLVLLGGDAGWRASNSDYGLDRLVALADEAERLASSDGLRANACFAKARVLTAFGELHDAVTTYERALGLADDPVTQFAVLINLGHHLASEDLERGWERLQEAHHLIAEGALAEALGQGAIELETAKLESRLGAAAFDLGRYGEALEFLVRCTAALRAQGQRDETAKATTFLGQVYTAIGMYEEGEAALQEAIASFAEEPESLSTRGYLRALLGRLYVKWDPPRLSEGRTELAAGREETADSGRHSTLPLADTYWAELLLAEGSPEALRDADATLAKVASFGWARGEIASSSVRAQIALAEGRVQDAVTLSTHALELLEEHDGKVPTVQSEQILLVHARALLAAGSDEARCYLKKADGIVREKADSLQDPAQRTSFLERVRLSRDVLDFAGSLAVGAE
jgi:tetratricopeptide (TPR) repeat protein